MATTLPHLQKSFKLIVEDGLPQATIEVVGSSFWLRCCPLCGSMHQIQAVAQDGLYMPLCQTHSQLYKAQLTAWHKLYPEVTNFTSIHLVGETPRPAKKHIPKSRQDVH
jgi:hypothetical protein